MKLKLIFRPRLNSWTFLFVCRVYVENIFLWILLDSSVCHFFLECVFVDRIVLKWFWGHPAGIKACFLRSLQKFTRAHGLFLLSISGQTHEFIINAMRQWARGDNLTICYRKSKLTPVFNASVLLYPVNIVKVVCGSDEISSLSKTGKALEKLTSIS